MKSGIISLGEALIDFIPNDDTNLVYQKSPGGAPANVSVGLARLGLPSYFLGKVGDDVLGRFLKEILQDYGVNTNYLTYTTDLKTGAVFVTLAGNGERSFDFYITPSADTALAEVDIKEDLFTEAKILHFGSILLIQEPSKSATLKAIQLAKQNGMLISYDPNLRLSLWSGEEVARETILSVMNDTDIVKISEDELFFLTGENEIDAGIEKLSSYEFSLLAITLGAEGSILVTKQGKLQVPAMKVTAVDTTGAGDAYVSGILYGVHNADKQLSELTLEDIKKIGDFASVSGGLAASTKGAMTALPTITEVQEILKRK